MQEKKTFLHSKTLPVDICTINISAGSKSESPETCRNDLSNYHKRWVLKSGGFITGSRFLVLQFPEALGGESLLEISPLVSYDGEGLEPLVKGKKLQLPLFLD